MSGDEEEQPASSNALRKGEGEPVSSGAEDGEGKEPT